MREVMLTIDVFSLIVDAVILYASVFENHRRSKKDIFFILFVVSQLLSLTADAVGWYYDGWLEMVGLIRFTTTTTIVMPYLGTLLFCYYVLQHISERKQFSSSHYRIVALYCLIFIPVATLTCYKGYLFTLYDAHYEPAGGYIIYLASIFVMYMYIFVLVVRNAGVLNHHDRIAFLAYALMPFLAMIINVMFPSLSLSFAATAVSILLIYVMLQSEEQQAAKVRETVLIERSYTDELTGVLNRRAYTDTCESIDHFQMVGIIFCDVNGLKYINDSVGHEAGDALLKRMTDILVSIFEKREVYRISGDEFVIIQQGVTEAQLEKNAERLRHSIQAQEYEITAIGSAWGRGDDLYSLITQAEEKMYVDKTIFHHKFPQYVRRGNLFIRDVQDDANQKQTELASIPPERPVPRVRFDVEKRKILIVENSKQTRNLIKSLLNVYYDVVETVNEKEGLRYLSEHPREISLIILDMNVQPADGYDFLHVQQTDSSMMHIPVIVTAGNNRRDIEEKCLRAGASDFLIKPYSPDVLLSRIRRNIEMKESLLTLSAVEYDELTGVYTRPVFLHHVQNTLERNQKIRFDLVLIDILGFNFINQRYGDKNGDLILRHIGHYLKLLQGSLTIVGRYGGDQFACFMPSGTEDGKEKWEHLLQEMERSAPVAEIVIKAGLYENVDRSLSVSALCDRAGVALKAAKHQYGMRCAMFDVQMQQSILREQHLVLDMGRAYMEEQFIVYFQPKIDARTGKMIGAEALLRWKHPEYGCLSPGEFIPLFEKNGFISQADLFVWKKTCQHLRRWIDLGLSVVPVSVNVSKMDFGSGKHLEEMNGEVVRLGLPQSLLHIEVTESVFTEQFDELISELNQCREYGYQIELDDFGSGFSSLNALGSLPIDVVKLDRQFIEEVKDERKIQVLSSCVKLAQNLGLKTVAEGVETEEQLLELRKIGCDYIQGFYYSKPLPEEEFEKLLID